MPTLTHVTLDTGDICELSRDDADDVALAHLRPLIDAEGGPIPWMKGWHLNLMRPLLPKDGETDGAAYMEFLMDIEKTPYRVALAICCWDESYASTCWRSAQQAYRSLRAVTKGKPALPKPPKTPWLTVWFTPYLALANPEQLVALRDLERCIAWALIGA